MQDILIGNGQQIIRFDKGNDDIRKKQSEVKLLFQFT